MVGTEVDVDDATRIIAALRRVTGAFTASGHRFGQRHGLGRTDVAALVVVTEQAGQGGAGGEGIGPAELARRLGITGAAATVLVDRLVAAGVVERQRHPRDGRRTVLLPTASALAAGREHFGALNAGIVGLLATHSAHDRRVAADLLAAVADLVERETALPPERPAVR